MKSIENDRQLAITGKNPFQTERRLYEKKEFTQTDVAVTVVVPDFYHVALPNLGHQTVEQQVVNTQGFYADRAYLNQEYFLLKEKPVLAPEIIFVSMSYEGSYIRALRVLEQLGCPLRRKDRREDDPIVVFGGWSVSRNPLPLFDLADAIGIGDSEHIVADITATYKENRGGKKQDFYNALAQKTGLILPALYNVATEDGYLTHWEAKNAPTEIYSATKSDQFPHSWYLSSETDYNDIGYYEGKTFFSMEIVDACSSKCAFCASGFREKGRDIQDPAEIAALAEWAAAQGADLAKLFFPANSSQTATKKIMKELMSRGLSPRVGSAKAEKIDTEYLELVGKSGQEKIAFAPETGDYELRRHLGKPGMTDEVLQRVIIESIRAGIPNLDFYLIMNLPGENQDSFTRSVDMLSEFYLLAMSRGLKGRVRMSAPNFFPKAGTPFQYAESGYIEPYILKIAQLNQELAGLVTISSMAQSPDLLSQNIMSRGGIEVGELLIAVHEKLIAQEQATGAYTPDTIQDWRDALANLGLNETSYFEAKDPNKPLPWHHIHLNSKIGATQLRKVWQVFQDKRAASTNA